MDPPAERELRALGAQFVDVDRKIRALLITAVQNNARRELLERALRFLGEMRGESLRADRLVMRAYAIAARALAELTGTAAFPGERVAHLGRSLSSQLLRAVDTAESSSRRHFANALEENVEELAIAGAVTRDARVISLGPWAELLTSTTGRHATAQAVPDTLGTSYSVEISGGSCEICEPLQGPARAGLVPPFHPNCDCEATPAETSRSELYAAQEAQL